LKKYKPGTYTYRKTNPRGSTRKEPNCREIVEEMKSKLLKPGEDSIPFSDAVVFVKKRLGRNVDDAVFYVDKRIFFSL